MAPEDVARYEAEGASLTIDDGVRYALGEVEIEDLLGSPGATRRARDGGGVTRSLPEGIVTFLFTDIEGSTRLLTDIGDTAYSTALLMHRTLVEAAADGERGIRSWLRGRRACSRRSRPRPGPSAPRSPRSGRSPRTPGTAPTIRVRMGLHTGEAQVVAGDYVGIEVHRAARVGRPRTAARSWSPMPRASLAGRPGRRHRAARPGRAPAQGLRAAGAPVPGRGARASRPRSPRSRRSTSRPTTCRPS